MSPLGALSSGGDPAALHSGTCNGLAIEHSEHQARIAVFAKAVSAELAQPPATIVQAMQRLGSSPEIGTTSYAELAAERGRLDETETAASRINCPVRTAAKLP